MLVHLWNISISIKHMSPNNTFETLFFLDSEWDREGAVLWLVFTFYFQRYRKNVGWHFGKGVGNILGHFGGVPTSSGENQCLSHCTCRRRTPDLAAPLFEQRSDGTGEALGCQQYCIFTWLSVSAHKLLPVQVVVLKRGWVDRNNHNCTVIRFLWVSAKFGTCTVVSVNRTLVEAKMCTFTLESTHFIFNKCPIFTHDNASAKFSPNSPETDYSVLTQRFNLA